MMNLQSDNLNLNFDHCNNSEKQINASLLSEGIYFLQLFDNNKSLGQQKFVKSDK